MILTDATGQGHDFTTPEGLRELARELAACPGGWDSHPQCGEFLAFIAGRYGDLCHKNGLTPADAQAAAFRAMIRPSFLQANDPFGVLTAAIVREIRAEARAERMMIGTEKARRAAEVGEVEVRRAGEHPWLLDTGAVAGFTAPGGGRWDGWVTVTARFLMCCEWPQSLAQNAAELLISRAADYSCWPDARCHVRADLTLAARLGLDRAQWRGLIRVLFGTDPYRTYTQLGVLRAVATDASLAELLADGPLCLIARRHSPGSNRQRHGRR